MKKLIYSLLFLFGISVISFSCLKEKNFPKEPVIKFKRYVKLNNGLDSATCTISFTDGDGDLGSEETNNDFKMVYMYKGIDGLFHYYDESPSTPSFDTLMNTYKVQNITPDGQYKALEGEIMAKLGSPPAGPIYVPSHTVIKFKITLRDRAGHLSNEVETDEINLQ